MSGTEHRSLSDVYGALRERAKSCDKKELLLQGLFLSRKYGIYVAGSFHLENVARSEKRKKCCKVSPFVARSSFPLGSFTRVAPPSSPSLFSDRCDVM